MSPGARDTRLRWDVLVTGDRTNTAAAKGIYDTEKSRRRILVTGSARLDYYRKGGDSLAGRYRYFRLHPFSLREFSRAPTRADVDVLLEFGGFPEPLFARNAVECKSGEKSVGAALRYFAERTPIPRFFQVHLGERSFESGPITVLPFWQWCEALELP